MSFVKRLRRITLLIFAISLVTAQSRDEVIELTQPVTGTMVDTNFVDVEVAIADFFTVGDVGCSTCDGYIQITMDGTAAGQMTSDSSVTVSGLSEGSHFIEVEALDPTGASFSPVVYDSATFTVDMESVPNICPARNLNVVAGDARNFLNWSGPIAMSNLNPFPSSPQSVNYHTGSTDGSSLIQNSLMMAHGGDSGSKEAGWAIFDLSGMNASIEVDSIIFNYYVNTTNWPYWSATAVNLNPLTASASDLHTEILAGSDAATAYLYRNEPSAHAPGWYSYALMNGANDDLEDDIQQDYFVIGVMDRDGSATYFLDFDGWNEANPPSIDIHWSAPGGRQGVHHAPSIADIPYSDDELMAYKNAVSEGLSPPTALVGIGSYESVSYPSTSSREIIEGCGDFQNYSVYTSDGTEVVSIDTNYYLHENLINGSEYCYYIIANYTEGASSATATVCATPETFIPDAVTNLSAVGLDEQISLSWSDPSVPQFSFYENFNSGIPGTWTVSDNNGSGVVWSAGENGPEGYTLDEYDGQFAIVTSYSNTFPNTDLISPSIDLSGFSSATLHYSFNYQDFAGNPTDDGSVYISGDGGSTWTLMNSYADDTPPGGFDVALSDTASLNSVVGSSDVKIKFHYEVESGESWFFSVDDIIVIGTDTSGSRDMTGSTVNVADTYIPGNTHLIEFSVNIQAPDFAYSDSLSLTFPAGVTVLDAGPEFLGFGGEPYGPEPFNGINGQTISWGTNADDGAGGIFGILTVWATLHFDSSLTGPLSGSFHVSDDWYNTPLDIDGNFTINQRDLTDGDLLGYNVYVDGSSTPHNASIIEDNIYLADGLTNGQEYSVGVTAVYFPNVESSPLEATATPTWLFGDISGIITDPNGNLLDSAIVRTGTLVDTTGSDGVFLLENLEPGEYSVTVMRSDFEGDAEDVTVLAQEAAVTQNFVLNPSLARSNGLDASAGDHQIDLIWNKPGAGGAYDLAYYDDNLEAQIGCGGGCEFGVRFTPLGYPATLTTLLITVQGDAAVISGNLVAVIDDAGGAAGPGGLTPVTLATGLDLSAVGGAATQYEVDVSAAGVVINSGDVYILIQENNSGFMGIGNDIQPQSPEYYDRNWVGLGDGSYMTIFDAVGGDASLTGDFGIMATFDGPSLATVTLNNINEMLEPTPSGSYTGIISLEVDAEYDFEALGYERSLNPENVIRLTDFHYPEPLARSMEDSLIGYNVYQVLDTGDTLVTTTSGADDTTATMTVPTNYVEYCYNVRARWNTDNYGVLEAKPTNDACAVPYTNGDVDFNSSVDLSDLLAVVDFVLEATSPSDDQFRGADVNMDSVITINDIVMIVDIIYGTNARTMASTDSPVLVDLLSMNQQLQIKLDYEGLTRGIQLTLSADALLEMGTPLLSVNESGMMVASNQAEDGTVTLVVVNTSGGSVDRVEDVLLSIPYTFKGNRREQSVVELTDFKAAGMSGESLPVTIREKRIDISVVPTVFALHQNYPNPFNPVTEIQFDVPQESQVQLTIYNIMGQEVTTLNNSTLQAGFHSIRWDGTNGLGEQVSTGVYFYRLSSPAFTSTKKMIMVK